MKQSNITRLQNFDRGTKWMSFIIRFRFPLLFIINGISFASDLLSQIGVYSFPYIIASLVMYAVWFTFYICAYMHASDLTMTGYKLLHIMFPIEVLMLSFSSAALQLSYTFNFGYAFVFFVVQFILLSAVWWLPNAIYFKKRKPLFIPPVPLTYTEKYTLNQPWKCDNCGRTNSAHIQACPVCRQPKPADTASQN